MSSARRFFTVEAFLTCAHIDSVPTDPSSAWLGGVGRAFYRALGEGRRPLVPGRLSHVSFDNPFLCRF